MNNFSIYNPVKVSFGKNCLESLPKSLKQYGNKVLFIYGKSSIIESGLYHQIKEMLKEFEIIEFAGIKSNPLLEDANAAAHMAKENNVDVILAVGGGSVIDTAKMVSLGAHTDESIWDFMTYKNIPNKATPLITVLTLAATGTEMNCVAVLQDKITMKKIGYGNPLIFPKESFLDPQLTTTVDAKYTAYGIVDLIAHSLETYFGEGDAPLADKFVYSIIDEAIEVAPELLKNLDNYELRARIMYAATMALNGTTGHGRKSGDWGVHAIGHELSLLFDIAHGATLSIAYPAWMTLMKERAEDRITELGSSLFGAQSADETISEFKNLFKSMGAPISLKECGIGSDKLDLIINQYKQNKTSGANYKLSEADYVKLVELMK